MNDGNMKTMKDMPLDYYSVQEGKKELLNEIDKLKEQGYSLEEIYKHLHIMYDHV